jgi:hypothetical protein
MMPLHIPLLVLALHVQDQPRPRVDCKEWRECRQFALDAAEGQDYETFHDLAWRAVQTGPKNDPALMYLLARAQSLSGRPSDALVMLQRLARMGTKTDAATNDDFRRVRALPGWAEFEGNAPSGGAAAPAAPPPAAAATPPTATATAPAARTESRSLAAEPRPAVSPAPSATPSAVAASSGESLRFTTPLMPAGLAYDAVSRRFIVGDRESRRLTVVDEFSQHVANLASAQSAGFGTIAALEIDPKLGNLWVVSGGESSAAKPQDPSASPKRTTLHKLQLISGRVLQSYELAERFASAAFVDVAAAADSTVLILDAAGHRVFRLRAKAQDLEVAATLPDERFVSIAPASENLAYVANEEGISVVDLATRKVTPLKAGSRIDLARVARLRWHKGSLVGIQQADGAYRAVRFALDRTGQRVTGAQILDAPLPAVAPTSAAISGGVLYYLAAGEGTEMIIRKITLP